jgi:hypothetical protein
LSKRDDNTFLYPPEKNNQEVRYEDSDLVEPKFHCTFIVIKFHCESRMGR